MDGDIYVPPTPASKKFPWFIILAIGLVLILGLGAWWFFHKSSPVQSTSITSTPTPQEPTATPIPEPTATATPTPSPKPTPKPTLTPIPPTATPTPAPVSVSPPTVNPGSSSSCPTTFNFSEVITVSSPTTVTYKWERSDGASAATQSLTFGSAGPQTVTDTWALSSSYSGWESVHILTPQDLTSSRATFSLTCP